MEASALTYSGATGLHGRSPLLRLQSDEKLVGLVRRGNAAAFEVLVGRYESRLLPFCRHMLRSREDAEDVLQEVFAAAYNALLADDRPINVRPWLYRIARNRSLNHLRRQQAIGVDSMDIHLSDHGATTADKVHDREEFRLLVGDIRELPETQRTALLLREMEALSYEQISEAMETTVPSVKSLLVRARVSLAEAAEARGLSCEEVRIQLGEVAEGLQRRPSPLVRRHLKGCDRCSAFKVQLKDTNKALAALLPLTPIVVLKKLVIAHLGHTAPGATAAGGPATAAGAGTAFVTSGAGGFLSTAVGAAATKAAAGIAAAALVTAGAVEVHKIASPRPHHLAPVHVVAAVPAAPLAAAGPTEEPATASGGVAPIADPAPRSHAQTAAERALALRAKGNRTTASGSTAGVTATAGHRTRSALRTGATGATGPSALPGRTQTTTDTTVLPLVAPAPATGVAPTSTTETTAPVTGPTGATGPATPSAAAPPAPSAATTTPGPGTSSGPATSGPTTTGPTTTGPAAPPAAGGTATTPSGDPSATPPAPAGGSPAPAGDPAASAAPGSDTGPAPARASGMAGPSPDGGPAPTAP